MPVVNIDIDLAQYIRICKLEDMAESAVKHTAKILIGTMFDELRNEIVEITDFPKHEVVLKVRFLDMSENTFLFEIEVSALDRPKRWTKSAVRHQEYATRLQEIAFAALQRMWPQQYPDLIGFNCLCLELVLKKGYFSAPK